MVRCGQEREEKIPQVEALQEHRPLRCGAALDTRVWGCPAGWRRRARGEVRKVVGNSIYPSLHAYVLALAASLTPMSRPTSPESLKVEKFRARMLD